MRWKGKPAVPMLSNTSMVLRLIAYTSFRSFTRPTTGSGSASLEPYFSGLTANGLFKSVTTRNSPSVVIQYPSTQHISTTVPRSGSVFCASVLVAGFQKNRLPADATPSRSNE